MKRSLSLLVMLGIGLTLSAQAPKPTFDVASVKRNISDSGAWSTGTQKGGAYVATNVPLLRIIAAAYDLDLYRVVGGPDWVRDTRFDVNAKAAADVPSEQIKLMLQSLLEDRFKLHVRKEQRDMPIYSLVVDRSDGRLGPGLQPVNNCSEARSRTPVGAPDAPNNAAGCGPIAVIASMAARQLAAPVVNNTGVSGTFAYSLGYSADLLASHQDAPSFPTALREQLGLKLEPARGPVDVLVIDAVQPPTEN